MQVPGKKMPPQTQDKPGLELKMRPLPEFEAEDYKAAGKLEDKVALITGGDSGIGRAVAVMYAEKGPTLQSSTFRRSNPMPK